jgi:hypothetical protein
MDIKIYTDVLENHLLQLLHSMYATIKCESIDCICTCRPIRNSDRLMWVEWTMRKVLPREGPPNYDWAIKTHKELRKFPCRPGSLTIKYAAPRAGWDTTRYKYGTNWRTGLNCTWDYLDSNEGGMIVYGQAYIPMPTEASDTVTVRLEWKFVPQV